MRSEKRVLLIGGTSDAARIAEEYLRQGCWVLHSRFSSAIALPMPENPRLLERFGPLDASGFLSLIRIHRITEIVDAAHPFAEQVHREVRKASYIASIPLRRVERDAVVFKSTHDLFLVDNHSEAAELCTQLGGTVLATIGSRNIASYQNILAPHCQDLFVRILDDPESYAACIRCGIPPERILAERGPFSIEQNLKHLEWSQASILVSKESGVQGGIFEKVQAARKFNCRTILIRRPPSPN